jgi:hypothetical protein
MQITEKQGRMSIFSSPSLLLFAFIRKGPGYGFLLMLDIQLADRNQQVNIETLMETLERRKSNFKKRFAVNVGSKIISVETRSVAYFYSMEKSTFYVPSTNR